ncbi:MAG: Hpt domain-containing protein [Desulfovibrio sp.]|jgi:HPt (histidine-containing phosphotransfer) domain-containing protein|nr:Hpt domain-containing protein [Desulfovibrio sp.]
MSDTMSQITRHFSQTMHLGAEATERILAKVRETLGRDIAALEECLGKGDASALPARLHKLKGDLSNIGLTELAAQAHDLQQEGAARPPRAVLEWVEELKAALAPLLATASSQAQGRA